MPINLIAGPGEPLTQSRVSIQTTDRPDEDVYTYYDLRNRKTYIQVTNIETEDSLALPTLCIHVHIFQQDKSCDELNFEDELTPNDTVVYDMDNLVRNDGTPVAANLDDDSYGFVAISAYVCGNPSNEETPNALIGNVRIIDDAGYEYRMNLVTDRNSRRLLQSSDSSTPEPAGNIIVPFNTVDGAKFADVVGFITEQDRRNNGSNEPFPEDEFFNDESGITFSVFQVDENEERISCDQKTFACGPGKVMNYGINDDYPASRGNNLLCEGGGLTPGQTNGYISLENATFLSPIDNVQNPPRDDFEFICLVGLNNGDNTGSMDECLYRCDEVDCIEE